MNPPPEAHESVLRFRVTILSDEAPHVTPYQEQWLVAAVQLDRRWRDKELLKLRSNIASSETEAAAAGPERVT